MAFVVTEPCVNCKYTDCVVVCPMECFYGDERQLYIDPVECICCGFARGRGASGGSAESSDVRVADRVDPGERAGGPQQLEGGAGGGAGLRKLTWRMSWRSRKLSNLSRQ